METCANHWFLSQMPAKADARLGQNQEPGTQMVSPIYVAGAQLLEPPPAVSKCTFVGSWNRK